jgi:RNA polymerase sigma-70 factor (ECF subfamily)
VEDQFIIKGCIKNDRKYQRMLLEKYSGQLMGTAIRYNCNNQTAKDMLQETWIKVFGNLHKYKEEGKLLPWMKRILINTILRSRQSNKMECVELSEWSEDAALHELPSDSLEMEDMIKMLDALRPASKEIFMMYVIDGFSHNEIGEILGITASTSRVHLANARKVLAELLKKNEQLIL